MSTSSIRPLKLAIRNELEALRGNWVWFLLLGIGLVILGAVAASKVVLATLAAVLTYGMLLIAGGLLQFVGSFWVKEWSGFFLHLIVGVLYFVVGILTVRHPDLAASALTLLLAAFFLVSGVFRIVGSFVLDLPGWIWVLLSGVVNVAMGLIIWAGWPISGLVVLGIFLAIELISNGIWWILIALQVRQIPSSLV
jgi:uncharacterized membrane protein HdeD (DUF308 family)